VFAPAYFIASSDQKNCFAAGSWRSINFRKCTLGVNLCILPSNLLSSRLLAKLKTYNRAQMFMNSEKCLQELCKIVIL